jgi:hypothetical protein
MADAPLPFAPQPLSSLGPLFSAPAPASDLAPASDMARDMAQAPVLEGRACASGGG